MKILTFRPRKSILETMKMLEAPSLAAFGQGSFFILSGTDSMGLMGPQNHLTLRRLFSNPLKFSDFDHKKIRILIFKLTDLLL